MKTIEVWKACPGYLGVYQVSSLGRVRRVLTARGAACGIIKTQTGPKGYRTVTLCHNGNRRWLRVNRLICEAFHGPAPEGTEAAHENGQHGDDRADNLSWKTPVANAADKVKHGTMSSLCGEANPISKLTDEIVRKVRKEFDDKVPRPKIAAKYGVSLRYVFDIGSRKSWGHLCEA